MWDIIKYKRDLSIFKDILSNDGVHGDFDIIDQTIEDLDGETIFQYDIKNLCFYIDGRIAGSVPDDLNYCQIFLDNMIALNDPLDQSCDPFHIYKLNITISLYKSRRAPNKAYTSSWHLDKEKDGANCKYTHPYYHFQFGGKKFEYLDPNMGLLNCPRIPHPPMDIFLAFHFVLNNFYNKKQFTFVDKIINNPDYINIIKRAQQRLWDPYFKAFDLTHCTTHQDFVVEKIFPLYLS